MSSLQAQLKLTLLDNVSGPANKVKQSLEGLRAAAAANAKAMATVRGQMVDAIAMSVALGASIKAPIEAASKFESSMLDIAQKADLTDTAMADLAKRIRALAPAINMTANEVAQGMDVLMGMGMEQGPAEKLLPTLGKAAVAYKAELTDLAKSGMAIMDNLKVKIEEVPKAMDMLAVAGKAGAFELKDMAQYLPSIAAMAQLNGMNGLKAVSELGSALQIVRKGAGDAAEAATNLTNVLQKMESPDVVKKFKKLAKIDLKGSMEKATKTGMSPLEAIVKITDKAIKDSKGKLKISDLFGDLQVQKGMATLVQNYELWRKMNDEVGAATETVNEDFARRMKTNEAQTKAFTAALDALKLSIGNALLPVVNENMKAMIPWVHSFEKFADENPKVVSGAFKLAAGLVGVRIATVASKFAFLQLRAAALTLATPFVAAASAMRGLVTAMAAGAVLRVAAAFRALRAAMLGVMLMGAAGGAGAAFKLVGAAILSMLNPIKLVTVALRVMRGAMIGTGIGALVVAIGALIKFVVDNWENFGKAWEGFKEGLDAATAGVPGAEKLANVIKNIGDWLGDWKMDPETFRAWGKAAGEIAGNALTALSNVIKTIGDMITRAAGAWANFKKAATDALSIGANPTGGNPRTPPTSTPSGTMRNTIRNMGGPEGASPAAGKRSDAGGKSFTVGDINVTVNGAATGNNPGALGKAIGAQVKTALESHFSDAATA